MNITVSALIKYLQAVEKIPGGGTAIVSMCKADARVVPLVRADVALLSDGTRSLVLYSDQARTDVTRQVIEPGGGFTL